MEPIEPLARSGYAPRTESENRPDENEEAVKDLLVVFSHGKESGPWGSKIRALAGLAERLGGLALSIDYRESPAGVHHDQNAPGEPERRVKQLLQSSLPQHRRLVLVGSSMGGYVSTVASAGLKVDGLFLLAPAFGLEGYAHRRPEPAARRIAIVHGWKDSVVPVANSIEFAQRCCCDLHLLDGDHRLNDVLHRVEPLFETFLREVASREDR